MDEETLESARNTPLPPESAAAGTSAWRDELALAREALKARVHQQQAEDGSIEVLHEAQSPESPPQDEERDEAGPHDAGGPEVRRGSTASIGAAGEEEDDDEEEDAVHEQLTGLRRRRTAASSATDPVMDEPVPPTDPAEDLPSCRICFSGDPEDEQELGKLFSPCVCRGTSRFVHVACLERWRKASANSASFYACDQCGYKYRFRRTRAAAIITSRYTVLALTTFVFGFLIWVSGYLANTMLAVAENRRAQLTGGFFEEFFVSDHVIMSEGVREAVSFFDSRLASLARPQDSIEYNDGSSDEPWTSRFYDILRNPGGARRKARKVKAVVRPPSWVLSALMHFAKGISLIGIVASFQAYAAASIVSPLGRGLFRALRPQARRGARDATANSMSQLVVIALVVLGVFKAIGQVYRLVKWMSKVALSRVENLVLDVR